MRAVTVLVFFGAATLLAACQSGPETIEATRPSITLRYDRGTELAAVEKRADDYCDRYNLDADLVDTGRQGTSQVALYECR